jgi:hypothetical protein
VREDFIAGLIDLISNPAEVSQRDIRWARGIISDLQAIPDKLERDPRIQAWGLSEQAWSDLRDDCDGVADVARGLPDYALVALAKHLHEVYLREDPRQQTE